MEILKSILKKVVTSVVVSKIMKWLNGIKKSLKPQTLVTSQSIITKRTDIIINFKILKSQEKHIVIKNIEND